MASRSVQWPIEMGSLVYPFPYTSANNHQNPDGGLPLNESDTTGDTGNKQAIVNELFDGQWNGLHNDLFVVDVHGQPLCLPVVVVVDI